MNADEARARGVGAPRGCLVVLGLYAGAAVILGAVWAAWPAGTDSTPPGPVPATSIPTSSSSYTRTPVAFPPLLDEVLSRAWVEGRHGCGITGPAVDDLAAALGRDIGEAPANVRLIASQWVAEHCRG